MYQHRPDPNHTGAIGKYRVEYANKAFQLMLLGATHKQLADFFEVSHGTIDYWLQHRKDFARAVKEGKIEADAKVANALYQRSIGYSYHDEVILTNRVNEYDKEGNIIRSYNKPLRVPVIKHMPPDVYAANKWLGNRQKALWCDSSKIDIQVNNQLNISYLADQLSDEKMYPDEMLEQALQLALEKATQNGPHNN